MKITIKLFLILLSFTLAPPLYAEVVEQKDLQFKIQTEELFKGKMHFSFLLLTPRELLEKFPEAIELDSRNVMSKAKVRVMMTKTAFIVDRPVGFFDHELMKNEKYISHLMGEQKIKKLNANTFKVSVPGEAAHTYKMKTFFDSDDISTLPNSRVIQGTTAAKKLDVISQSASSILLTEYSSFSKYAYGGTTVTSYIPLKEEKTLVITYRLMGVKKYYALENVLKSNFLKEMEAVKKLINSYTPQ